MKQLAHRRDRDFDVALFWDRRRDKVFVVVEDIHAGDRCALTPPNGKALDAFRHPFAYGAFA